MSIHLKPVPMAKETERIESLRDLMSLVVHNTKLEMQGRASKTTQEGRALEKHLNVLLGRKPQPEEIAFALRY